MNDAIDEKKDSFIHIRCCGLETDGYIADYKQKIKRLPRNFHEQNLFVDHCRAIALCIPKWMSKKARGTKSMINLAKKHGCGVIVFDYYGNEVLV